MLSTVEKEEITQELVRCLEVEPEVKRIVIFGSFLTSETPNDIDVAVFQDSNLPYLPLAMKYREKTNSVYNRIPMDIIPLRLQGGPDSFMDEVNRGQVVYERGC